MKQKIYQVDAFTDKVFSGNPAAVCPLEEWLDTEIMQKIAAENNLAETTFFVKKDHVIEIRWFTPTVEVDLCGHATLAAAFVLFFHENHSSDLINFHSHRSGPLSVRKDGDFLTLNFPSDPATVIPISEAIANCFDRQPQLVLQGRTDYLLIYEKQEDISLLQPRFDEISKLPVRGVIVSAKGNDVDFVSRFFGPQCGINEDPVTGSAHTTLTPYWSSILNKKELTAIQLSDRKGHLRCTNLNDRVEISGQGKLFMIGELFF
jgi:PhzF family phenazine biosynthesis protein